MRRDRRAPALYELIRGPVKMSAPSGAGVAPAAPASPAPEARPAPQPRAAAASAAMPPPAGADEAPGGPLFAGPGRSIAVPVGYFWISAGALVLLLIGAYAIGYKQHEREVAALRAQQAEQQFEGVVDPTNAPATIHTPATNAPVNPGLITQAQPDPQTMAAGSSPAPRLIVITKNQDDPREAGLNYFIVANLPPAEAERAGQFLVSKGVAAMVAPADTKGLCQVVALRGFPAGTLDEADCTAFKDRLRAIGREYKRAQKGPTDFADLFPRKHRRDR